jgi:hypothetical protein
VVEDEEEKIWIENERWSFPYTLDLARTKVLALGGSEEWNLDLTRCLANMTE